jgi:hypothetical protein
VSCAWLFLVRIAVENPRDVEVRVAATGEVWGNAGLRPAKSFTADEPQRLTIVAAVNLVVPTQSVDWHVSSYRRV